tara:strand:- start:143 stop:631 length:489 start_codon:yes stop_codon:yes gene_type:complete
MSYIGYKPVQGNVVVDEFTSTGGSTYTLSSQPTNNNTVEVVVGGLTQTSSAYSFSGDVLTLAGVASGTKIIVRQHGEKLLIPTPGDATVTTTKIADDAVTAAKIADGTIGPSLGSSSQWIRTNSNSISQNVTIPSGTNAMSVGPITLAAGNTITCNGVYRVI